MEHDLTARRWGRNYAVHEVIDKGRRLRVSIIATPLPKEGEFVVLRNGDGTTRYRLDAVEPCFNPPDMAFADLSFAPRISENTHDESN